MCERHNFFTPCGDNEYVHPNRNISLKIKTCDDGVMMRPISLLSIFNRIFEKLKYNRLKSFIEKKELLYEAQYGSN